MTGGAWDWVLLGVAAFVAALLAAVTGFGSAPMLLPLLAAVCGVREAVPALTVTQLLGNAGRAWLNRRDLNWRVVGWFSLGAVPAAVVGGVLFASISAPVLTRLLGAFLLVIVAYRRLKRRKPAKMPLRAFAPLGAVGGFISALLGGVGPLLAPFFLAYGLTKASYVATIALSAIVMHVAKLAAYGGTSMLTPHAILLGLALGLVMLPGSWVGKKLVERVSERVFVIVVEVALVASGVPRRLAGEPRRQHFCHFHALPVTSSTGTAFLWQAVLRRKRPLPSQKRRTMRNVFDLTATQFVAFYELRCKDLAMAEAS